MNQHRVLYVLVPVIIAGFTNCSDPVSVISEKLPVTVTVILPNLPQVTDTTSLPVPSPADTVTIPLTDPGLEYGTVRDIDSNLYKTIKLFGKVWMAENLRTTTYNDKSAITPGEGGPAGFTDWFGLTMGAYCWYDNDSMKYNNIGTFYNWLSAGTGKLCPMGWHVPDYQEWVELIVLTGGSVEDFSQISENVRMYQ